jgi:hypothetical protein
MKKRNMLLVGALAILLAGCLAIWLTIPKHKINLASFEKIDDGMSLKQVEEILRVPPGDYLTQPIDFVHIDVPAKGTQREWHGDDGLILVWFDERGVVCEKEFIPAWWEPESFVDRFRRWLGLGGMRKTVTRPIEA